jgi:hypothetical protein
MAHRFLFSCVGTASFEEPTVAAKKSPLLLLFFFSFVVLVVSQLAKMPTTQKGFACW